MVLCTKYTETDNRPDWHYRALSVSEMRRLSVVICCSLLHLVLAQEEAEVSNRTYYPQEEAEVEITREETKIIFPSLGAVRGVKVTEKEATHYELLGLPYAEPPVGKLRFQPPAPVR